MSVLPAADTGSREWLRDLRADGAAHDDAVDRLHTLLLHAARFEAARRRGYLPHLHAQFEEIAREAADDALVSVLARLEDFRGESRFTTWAYKFALVETAVKLRKRDWQRRELPLEPDTWQLLATQTGIDDVLTEHERRVLVAVALSGVPIDVLADRLDSTRGSVYQTLHDARIKLRAHLAACGVRVSVR